MTRHGVRRQGVREGPLQRVFRGVRGGDTGHVICVGQFGGLEALLHVRRGRDR
jgi:hypothetical protein